MLATCPSYEWKVDTVADRLVDLKLLVCFYFFSLSFFCLFFIFHHFSVFSSWIFYLVIIILLLFLIFLIFELFSISNFRLICFFFLFRSISL